MTKPEHIQDFYKNNELIALTHELTDMLRRNRTIDWQKKETARASMRKMVKRLLKKYKYPPEDYDMAISTVISQCEMWTDNMDTMPTPAASPNSAAGSGKVAYSFEPPKLQMVAEEMAGYGSRKES